MKDILTFEMIEIIKHYDEALNRLARRIILDKDRADDAVKWAMETIYDDEEFYNGPHLRSLLIKRTIEMALDFNKAIEVRQKLLLQHRLN
jgi:hypothetical protein